MNHYFQKGRIIIILQSVCGRIRTFGALSHTTLAGWHHRPLGHTNGKWMGQDSNLRCFFVMDLQSAGLHSAPVAVSPSPKQQRCGEQLLKLTGIPLQFGTGDTGKLF